jgi:hypothetical protein
MAITTILKDTKNYPLLFNWTGGIPHKELEDWLLRESYTIPSDLETLWNKLGGGDIFESETILHPWLGKTYGDDTYNLHKYHHALGMSLMYLIFHVGMCLSSVRLSDGKFVTLDKIYQEIQVFDTLDKWYVQVIRSEYKERYGVKE